MDETRYHAGPQSRVVYNRWGFSTSFLTLGLSAVLITALLVQVLNEDLISATDMMHNGLANVGTFTAAILASLGLSHASNTTETLENDNFEIDLSWYPPKSSPITNLTTVINSTGVWGFIFNTSHTPDSQYGTYNWCNMPHVRAKEYPKPPSEYELLYVEVIHRHHLRTPYGSNSFPVEPEPWNCDDIVLFSYSSPLTPNSYESTPSYYSQYSSSLNPFSPSVTGLQGSCSFPQITLPGLSDSFTHGRDLFSVYAPLIRLDSVGFRVTNNPITSQVAGALISGIFHFSSSSPSVSNNNAGGRRGGGGGGGGGVDVPLLVQHRDVDSLKPKYPCPASRQLFSQIQSTPQWKQHLSLAEELFNRLDTISGVPPTDSGFHVSFDHYYDNLSAKQCHSRPLPCSLSSPPTDNNCITQQTADAVYRLGQWEYYHTYRGSADSLRASVASYGVWIAELVAHITQVVAGQNGVRYRHNIAHDGSISRLLGVLQIEGMHWPGMGAEIVFEVYKREARHFVRVLYGGQVLKSSSPMLRGDKDGMIPVEKVVGYLGGLIKLREEGGRVRHDVRDMCNA